MTLTAIPDSLKDKLNNMTEGNLAEPLRAIAFGDFVRQSAVSLRKQLPVLAQDYNIATLYSIKLPDNAKASTIARATVRAGAVTGELVVKLFGVTPGTGEIAVSPNGDLVFFDAVTDVDVRYTPDPVDVYEMVLPTPSGVLTIPPALVARGVVNLLEAEALTVNAGVVGKKIVLVPGTAPATLKANLNVAKTQVLFNVATDLVLTARVKIGVVPAVDRNALLEAKSPLI